MASRHAPSSFLIGMDRGNDYNFLVGVQIDQVEKLDDGKRCRIKMGRPTEIFDIVRENKYLAVVRVPIACVFTGDFPHAGVKNVAPGSSEAKLLEDLNRRIGQILAKPFPSHEKRIKAIVEMFCEFKDLDRLCRLHISTELRGSRMVIPRNSIGYTDCKLNTSTPADLVPRAATAAAAAPSASLKGNGSRGKRKHDEDYTGSNWDDWSQQITKHTPKTKQARGRARRQEHSDNEREEEEEKVQQTASEGDVEKQPSEKSGRGEPKRDEGSESEHANEVSYSARADEEFLSVLCDEDSESNSADGSDSEYVEED